MTVRVGNPDFAKLKPDRELSEVERGMLIAEYSKHGSIEKAAKTLHFDPRLAYDVISRALDEDPSIPTTAAWAKEFGMAYREVAWLMIDETKKQLASGKIYGKNLLFSSKVAKDASDSCFKAWQEKSGHKAQPKTEAELEAMEKKVDEQLTRFGSAEAGEAESAVPTGGDADTGAVEQDNEPEADGRGRKS